MLESVYNSLKNLRPIALVIITMVIGSTAVVRASDPLVVPAPQLDAETATPTLLTQSSQDLDLFSGPKPASLTAQAIGSDPKPDAFRSSVAGEDDFYRYYASHGKSGLVAPASKPGFFTRTVDAVCRPTELHVGGMAVTVSCSTLSAVQHRDPVHLFDPCSITISW